MPYDRLLLTNAMLPSLIQPIFDTLPSNGKHVSTLVTMQDMSPPRNMEDFLAEVEMLFSGPTLKDNMLDMSARLQTPFKEKMQNKACSMLPTFIHTMPTGQERGTHLALDVGGSTFRVALVTLDGQKKQGNMEMIKLQAHKIDNGVRALKGTAFFDWMAQKIAEFLSDGTVKAYCEEDILAMGLAWSFPLEQTSMREGILLDMGKGFSATHGILGQEIGGLIVDACRRNNLKVQVEAIINDSAATLLSRAYQDNTTRMALILGTGMNAAALFPAAALASVKYGERPVSWHDQAVDVLVNIELSMFGRGILPLTRWDEYINDTHTLPDFQPLEYIIGGRYLGETIRLVMLEAIQDAGLFDGEVPKGLDEPYSFDTGLVASIECDNTPSMSTAISTLQSHHPLPATPSLQDMQCLRLISRLVMTRAAAYLATAIHALWALRLSTYNVHPSDVPSISMGCNGSVIERYPGFRSCCQAYLDALTKQTILMSGQSPQEPQSAMDLIPEPNYSQQLTEKQGKDEDDVRYSKIKLEVAMESAIFGAAVAVCCARITEAEEQNTRAAEVKDRHEAG